MRRKVTWGLALAILGLLSMPLLAHAQMREDGTRGPQPVNAEPIDAAAPPRAPGRFIAHLNVGLVAMNWTAAHDGQPSHTFSLANRQLVLQLAGFGYFVSPHVRVMLSLQLVELLANGPPGAHTLTLGGAIPWLAWHFYGPLFAGVGVLLAFRNYGKNQFDAGLWTAVGAAMPVGHGFSLGLAVQMPLTFVVRTAFTVAPAAFVAARF